MTLALASIIIFVAFFIRSLTGFGAALICIPLLALMYDLAFIVPLELLFELAVSLILTPRLLKDIDYRNGISVLTGSLIGIPLGAHGLATIPNDTLKMVLAALVLFFAGYLAITVKRPLHLGISPRWGLVFGLVGGVFGGAFMMSGPLVVLFLAHQIKDKSRLRATIFGVFFVASFWAAGVFCYQGLFTAEMFETALYLSPAFLVATFLGHWAHLRTSDVFFRGVIATILFVSFFLLLFGGM